MLHIIRHYRQLFMGLSFSSFEEIQGSQDPTNEKINKPTDDLNKAKPYDFETAKKSLSDIKHLEAADKQNEPITVDDFIDTELNKAESKIIKNDQESSLESLKEQAREGEKERSKETKKEELAKDNSQKMIELQVEKSKESYKEMSRESVKEQSREAQKESAREVQKELSYEKQKQIFFEKLKPNTTPGNDGETLPNTTPGNDGETLPNTTPGNDGETLQK